MKNKNLPVKAQASRKKAGANRPKVVPRKPDPLAVHRLWLSRAADLAVADEKQGGSPHPTVKVGAILVDDRGRMIASSSNRFADGVDRRRPERFENCSRSLWINCAEQMALAQAARKKADITRARLYVTLEPCAICAGLIAAFGVREVYFPVHSRRRYAKLKTKWKHSIDVGLIKLAEAGVKVTAIYVDDLGTGVTRPDPAKA